MTKAASEKALGRAYVILASLGVMFAWCTFSYTFFASLEGLRETSESTTFWFYFVFVAAACVGFGVLAVFGRRVAALFRSRSALVCVVGAVETMGFIALKFFAPAMPQGFALLILVLASVCMCLLVASWGDILGALAPREAGNIIALSFLLFGMLTALNGFLERGFMSWLTFVLPMVSGAAYLSLAYVGCAKIDDPREMTSSSPWGALRFLDRRLVLFALLFYVCDPVMAFLTPSRLGPFEEGTKYIVGTLGLVFALLVFLAQRGGGFRVSGGAFQVFVGISFLLIFAAVVLWGDRSPDIAVSCVVSLRKALIAVLWLVLCSLAAELKLPSVPLFCMANLLLCAIPNLLRLGYTLIFDAFELPRTLGVDAVALGCLVLMGCVAVVMLARDRTAVQVGSSGRARDTRADACGQLAQKAGLTERETEVFELLARGYTLPGVSEALNISLNTVRSHSKSIYRKLGIDSKQNLIATVEREMGQL